MSAHEIRVLLGGISRQRVYQITTRRDFPAPVADLAHGKIWLAHDVEAWITVHRRQRRTPLSARPASRDRVQPPNPPRAFPAAGRAVD